MGRERVSGLHTTGAAKGARYAVKQSPTSLGYQSNIKKYKRKGTVTSIAAFVVEFYRRPCNSASITATPAQMVAPLCII